MQKITTGIEKIGPEEAVRMLETRGPGQLLRFRKHISTKYADAMRTGRWLMLGDSIDMDTTGALINGQHRISAVVESGLPQSFVVVRGVDPSSFVCRDRGLSRQPGQILGMAGYKYPNAVASAAVILWREEKGTLAGSWGDRPETDEILAVAEAHPGLVESARIVANNGVQSLLKSNALATWAHYRFGLANPIAADEFFGALASGAELAEGSAILRLRNRLVSLRASKMVARQKDIAILLVRAWNAFVSGKRMGTLKMSVVSAKAAATNGSSTFPKIMSR